MAETGITGRTIICDGCGKETLFYCSTVLNEKTYCSECIQKNYFWCWHCARLLPRETPSCEDTTYGIICLECAAERNKVCTNCNKIFFSSEIIDIPEHGGLFCTHCVSNLFTKCTACKSYLLNAAVDTGPDGAPYCAECYNITFTRCFECNAMHFIGSGMTTDTGEHICSTCRDENYELREFTGVTNMLSNSKRKLRTIGIEIECYPSLEEHKKIRQKHLWHSCSDMSLHANGMEYQSPILDSKNYKKEISTFCDNYLLDAKIDYRCGLHIHLGAEDYYWHQLNNLLRYCKQYQSDFYSLVSSSRRNGHFSLDLPTFTQALTKQAFIEDTYGNSDNWRHSQKSKYPESTKQDNIRIQRYHWLNLQSYLYRKTIEIRLHQGTVSATKINNWIDLWVQILPIATSSPTNWQTPLRLIRDKKPKLYEYWMDRRRELDS